jgi:hypothetical protein
MGFADDDYRVSALKDRIAGCEGRRASLEEENDYLRELIDWDMVKRAQVGDLFGLTAQAVDFFQKNPDRCGRSHEFTD